jgi:UDP-N-acetylmuramoyl-tripeptide--D-alanyl-D-alanine ligase
MIVVEERATVERFGFALGVPGDHNVCNALFAIAVARGHGIGWDRIKAALRRFRPPPMRWSVEDIAGVRFINDAYNANPLGMRAAIGTFAGLETSGGKWLVLGGMLELGAWEIEEHRAVGRLAAAGPWTRLVVVGERGGWIARGAAEAGMSQDRIAVCETGRQAARVLADGVTQGDAVLLKASRGMRLEEVRDEYVLLSLRMVAEPSV